MAYTFGAATADDITFATGQTLMAASKALFVSMWILPTTLTSGRTLWSCGNINCGMIHSTTSEVAMNTDESTGAAWHTTGAALAVGKWSYLAWLGSWAANSAVAWRVWSGTAEIAPVECTVTQDTAPGTGFTGNANFTIGNKGTGVLAFQGDIDLVCIANSSGVAADAPLNVPATIGTLTQAEADLVNVTLVQPLWQGDYSKLSETRRNGLAGENNRWFVELTAGPIAKGHVATAADPYAALTINGATLSNNQCPRRPFSRPVGQPWDRR